MTDRENWQRKPEEGGFSARRDGEKNYGNRRTPDGSSFDRPRRKDFNDSGNSFYRENRFDRPGKHVENNGNFSRKTYGERDGGFDRPRRNHQEGGENRFDRPHPKYQEGNENRFDRPRPFNQERNENRFNRPRSPYGENRPNRYGESNRERPDFDRPRRSFGEQGVDFDRPRRSYHEGGADRNNRGEGYGHSRSSFSGPMLPPQPRSDGRPRRPRIQKERNFDHGAPYGSRFAPKYQISLDPDTPIRLNKFLANAGICSRREADEFIQAGVVKVNGEVVSELGVKVKPSDNILFHDQPVSIEHKIYILLNKPKDCVTTSDDPQDRLTVMDLVKGACVERIYPVGRLDRNTTGVLLLTNDGDLASKLTHPKYEKRKIYQVTLDKDLVAADIQIILDGVKLEDCEVKADNLSYVDPDRKSVVGIEIHSGQNRVVRRIFESLGYKIYRLDRVYFAGLTKKNLPRGKWRHLTEKEVNLLKMGAFV